MILSDFKKQFDGMLQTYIAQKVQQSKKIANLERTKKILDHLIMLTLAGGKRIRPYCAYSMYQAYGWKNSDDMLLFARVFEVLHTMALIHDDIIDEADKRHNTQTVHHYTQSLLDKNNTNISNGQAIMIWDLVLARVYELLDESYNFSKENFLQAKKCIHEMIQEVILWQMIDIDMMVWDTISEDVLYQKNLYKSARYTFMRPMLTGAILAWANKQEQKHIQELWEKIWLAYQIRDDLQDILWTQKDKKVFSDIQEWQQTYITQHIIKTWTQEEKDILKKHRWKKCDDKAIQELQRMFHNSGTVDFTKQKITTYLQEAEDILSWLSFLRTDYKQYIQKLIDMLYMQ